MTEITQNSPTSEISVARECLKDRHFLIVATVLAVVWIGWAAIMHMADMVFQKEAVAWPVGVEVHQTEFRMLSLPTSFGPDKRFELAGDGELFYPASGELFVTKSGDLLEGVNGVLMYKGRGARRRYIGELSDLTYKKNDEPVLDGVPDGEKTIIDEVLESLGIGTWLDSSTFSERKSAWYVSRTYVDRQKPMGQKYRLWQLDVTYYTGGLNKVPHVPERCLTSGGMTLGVKGDVKFNVPDAPGPWGSEPVTYRFVEYNNPRGTMGNLHVQYYVFSLLGYPQSSWERVRLNMFLPYDKYAYFAKIQFSPMNEIGDSMEAKKAAAEFVKYMLPEVLKVLPMPTDIERLESGAQ
jgi:hypothetical protein